MNVLKLTLAAATVSLGIATSAAAMPLDNLSAAKTEGVQAEKTALVCNRWGRCWHTGWRRGYRAYGYGYGYGWRHHRHWR
jgi:hypothetical protein